MCKVKKEYRYEGMSDKQVQIINIFTQFKTATTIQKKMGELISGEDANSTWTYDGYKDTGFKGGDHCSMGHALRYVHIAKNKLTGEKVKFGIKCISDFFSITPEKLKMIQEGFIQTNKMVDQIVEKFKKGDYRFEEMNLKFSQVIQRPEHYIEIANLLHVDLPLPNDFEREINDIWFREYNGREFQKFLDLNPKYAGIVVMAQMCQASDSFSVRHPELHKKMDDIVKYLNKNKKLSEPQIKLLNKIMMIDHEEMDTMIDDIKMVPIQKFRRFEGYNEYETFLSLVDSYEHWGLTEGQIKLMVKIHTRLQKYINETNAQELAMAE